jgi:hypothetical protein
MGGGGPETLAGLWVGLRLSALRRAYAASAPERIRRPRLCPDGGPRAGARSGGSVGSPRARRNRRTSSGSRTSARMRMRPWHLEPRTHRGRGCVAAPPACGTDAHGASASHRSADRRRRPAPSHDARAHLPRTCEHAGVTNRVPPLRRHRGRQPGQQRQGIEVHRERPVGKRALQRNTHQAVGSRAVAFTIRRICASIRELEPHLRPSR